LTDSTANDDPLVADPTWNGNIEGFFRPQDVACMKGRFDLSSYESVKTNAQQIHDATASGAMPLGGPRWSPNRVQTFQNWMNAGFPEGPTAGGGGGSTAPTDDPLVPNPTWTGNVQGFFDAGEIACMNAQGIDLSSYASVKGHSTDIYEQTKWQNMPQGGPPWSSNRVQTFLNWINTGFPYSPAESTGGGTGVADNPGPRHRKNVNSLSAPEIELLKTAFRGIMALDPTDPNSPVNPNSYFGQAANHGLPLGYCNHHVDTYNPWHRVYVTQFEDALRSIAGCESVTLPYWDITEPTVPALFSEEPFTAYTLNMPINDPNYPIPYTTSRNSDDKIITELAHFGVADLIERSLGQPLYGHFQVPEGYQQPVIYAHDSAHNSCGPTMSDQDVASYDPIFWFFHCNWERVFWSWQVLATATDVDGFTATLGGETGWLGLALNPYPDTTNQIIPYSEVSYEQLATPAVPVLKSRFGHVDATQAFTIPARAPVSVRVKDIDRMAIRGTFVVHLLADGEEIAKQAFFQPKSPRDCRGCRKQALVSIDFRIDQAKVLGRRLTVEIESIIPGESRMQAVPLGDIGSPTINARLLLEEA
jgi:hypothetical protein